MVKKITLVALRPVLAVACLAALTACSSSLDTKKIASTIQDEIIKQGGLSLKEVICPEKVPPESGKAFDCLGVLDAGGVFAIPVTQQDDKGSVRWKVSSVRGLINMSDLQAAIQQELQKEKDIGQATVDCGRTTTYKATKPGDTFECKLLKRGAKPDAKSGNKPGTTTATKPDVTPGTTANAKTTAKPGDKKATQANQSDMVVVTVDPSGSVNWQRVLPGANLKGPATPPTSQTAKTGKPATGSPTAAQATPKPKITTENIPDPNRPSDSEVLVD